MDPNKPWDYCDCDPPPKLFIGNDGVIQDVLHGDFKQIPDRYHTDTTEIPSTIGLATSSALPRTTELPITEASFDAFAMKSFQLPDSMPVYNFKGKCLRHCSTSQADNLLDRYPFQVSVSIHGRDYRKVLVAWSTVSPCTL